MKYIIFLCAFNIYFSNDFAGQEKPSIILTTLLNGQTIKLDISNKDNIFRLLDNYSNIPNQWRDAQLILKSTGNQKSLLKEYLLRPVSLFNRKSLLQHVIDSKDIKKLKYFIYLGINPNEFVFTEKSKLGFFKGQTNDIDSYITQQYPMSPVRNMLDKYIIFDSDEKLLIDEERIKEFSVFPGKTIKVSVNVFDPMNVQRVINELSLLVKDDSDIFHCVRTALKIIADSHVDLFDLLFRMNIRFWPQVVNVSGKNQKNYLRLQFYLILMTDYDKDLKLSISRLVRPVMKAGERILFDYTAQLFGGTEKLMSVLESNKVTSVVDYIIKTNYSDFIANKSEKISKDDETMSMSAKIINFLMHKFKL